jgi:NAD(P)H-hydrate epimerase
MSDATPPPSDTPVLDRAAARAVDRAATEEYGIPGIVLMENAARALAAETLDMLGGSGGRVVIVCGAGNNGGDGWALARHLHNAGVDVTVVSMRAPRVDTDAAVNCRIARAMGVPSVAANAIGAVGEPDVIVDAIFGTGLDRPIGGDAVTVIDWINGAGCPVLAVDLPSGLDCDTGAVLGVAVRAARTVSFVGTKPAFAVPAARPYVGTVVIGDIGAPRELARRLAVGRRE